MEKKHANAYNGWSNYETWTVSLWLDNEESSYRYWREQALSCRHEASQSSNDLQGNWTPQEMALTNLADRLKCAVTEQAPLQEPGMYSDLLAAALSEVSWTEIAEHWIDE